MHKIDLGCGKRKHAGFFGLDDDPEYADIIWHAPDPIPFEDKSVDHAIADNFLEHLPSPAMIAVLNDLHRVLSDDGILELIVPDAMKDLSLAISDPTHQSFWCMHTFKYISGARPRYSKASLKPWHIVELRHYDEKEPKDIFARLKPKR